MAPEAFVDVLAKGSGGGIALERLDGYLLAGDPPGLRFDPYERKDLHYGCAKAGSRARPCARVHRTT